jgi:hypothetical protein
MIRSSQKTLPTQYTTHETNVHVHAGFEPAIPAIKRLQTYYLDSTAIGIGCWNFNKVYLDVYMQFI